MAEQSCRKRLQDEGSCSICLDYFKDPVTLDCGHNFCRACIANVWRTSSTDATCPRCSETVKVKRLRPNRQLASMVQIAKDLSDLLKNRVVSVEEAAQECKDQISRSLMILKKERENILACKAENEKESQDLLKQIEADREKTSAAFKQLHQNLEEQEKLLKDQSEKVEKEIVKKRDEHLATLTGELSSLDSLVQEMEEKQQQSTDELLQNLGDLLERCHKESFESREAFPVELKWRIHEFCNLNPCLEYVTKVFKDCLASGLQLQEAKVLLDVDTAHPQLRVSQDRKSVRRTDEWEVLPDNPERFDGRAFVLGCEGFVTGRHFWDITVGNGEWSVGVAKKCVRRKGSFEAMPEAGIWSMGLWNGEYRFFVSANDTPLHLNQELKKIRVTLNYTGGQVAFFDANTGTKLCEYSDASFSGETVLPFFWASQGAQLTLCS